MQEQNNIREVLKDLSLIKYVEYRAGGRLKRIGNNFFIYPCPFCGKQDNHFAIKEKDNIQLFKCFCNSAGGSLIDFIIEYEGLSNKDAIKQVYEVWRG